MRLLLASQAGLVGLDPDPLVSAYLRLGASTEAMRSAPAAYLRLAQHITEQRERAVCPKCAAFFAQLAEGVERLRDPKRPQMCG